MLYSTYINFMGVCFVSFRNVFYSSLNVNEKKICDIALNKFEPYENSLCKELIEFSIKEIIEANRNVCVLAQYQDRIIRRALMLYFKFGESFGFHVEEIISFIESPSFFEKDANSILIKSPIELSKKFLEWFPTIHLDTPEVQYATILWLFFEGVTADNILSIKAEDVKDDKIIINGAEHFIPPCISPFVYKTRDLEVFNCFRKEGTICSPQRRCNNGFLIRTNNPTNKSKFKHIVDKIFERIAKADSNISANSLMISGACWETKTIYDETGMFTFYAFANRQGWDGADRSGATSLRRKYAKYDYANYIRTFYPDEAK